MSRSVEVWCRVRVSHCADDLSAHVELEGDLAEIAPGDRVKVHGPPLTPAFGEVLVERRRATVTRASWFQRTWTRLTGDFSVLSLVD